MSKGLKRVCILLCVVVIVGLAIYIHEITNTNIEIPAIAVREPVVREPREEYDPPISPVMEIEEPDYKPEEPPLPPELMPRIVQLREYYDNPDIIGFIEIPGTNIAYPVAQTGNNVFYLYHDLNWNANSAGTIFLDYENDLYALADDNTIIYGHNMRNGSMFHNIRYFHNEDFFREHTYILLDTPYRETMWDIFAFFHTTTDFCYLTTNFFDDGDFYEFMLLLQSMSRWSTDIEIMPDDQILILSTCGVHGGNNRYVVVARLRGCVQ